LFDESLLNLTDFIEM